jgi:hypothetical protein
MKSKGASTEAIQAVIGASLVKRGQGEDYSRLHAPAWGMSAGFSTPSWLSALQCLDVEEFDGREHCDRRHRKCLPLVGTLQLGPGVECLCDMP